MLSSEALDKFDRTLAIIEQDRNIVASGRKIELFCDARDVRWAVLGMSQYVDPETGRVNLVAFSSDAALANCLLAIGMLGQFRMLAPHQAEFLSLLETDVAFRRDEKRPEQERMFLREVGVIETADDVNEEPLDLLTPEFVQLQAGRSQRFFKAFQCVRYGWRRRVVEWRRRGWLVTSMPKTPLREVVRQPEFRRLRVEFGAIRRGQQKRRRIDRRETSRNDFADAVALMILINLSRRACEDEQASVPRFFDSTRTFQLAARRAGVMDDLVITDRTGVSTSVLVDANYLINWATFGPLDSKGEPGVVSGSKLRAELAEILGEEDRASRLRALEQHKLADKRKLADVVGELIQCTFLTNVWLAELDLQQLALEQQAIAKETADPKFRNFVNQIVAKTKDELNSNAREYRQIGFAWTLLEKGVRDLRERLAEVRHEPQDFDAERDLELIRFSLHAATRERVDTIVRGFLDPERFDEDLASLDGWDDLLDAYLDAPNDQASAELAAATLWAMRYFPNIVRLSPLAGNGKSIPLDLLYAAACVRTGKIGGAERVLRDLRKQFRESVSSGRPDRTIALGIGLGYLLFHLWLHGRRQPQERVNEAIECARTAWNTIDACSPEEVRDSKVLQMRRAYAINQVLFYMTRRGWIDDRFKMKEIADVLADVAVSMPEAWMPTFSHTLALSLRFQAQTAASEEHWLDLMKKALREANRAADGVPWDEQVVQDAAAISVEIVQGFEARRETRGRD